MNPCVAHLFAATTLTQTPAAMLMACTMRNMREIVLGIRTHSLTPLCACRIITGFVGNNVRFVSSLRSRVTAFPLNCLNRCYPVSMCRVDGVHCQATTCDDTNMTAAAAVAAVTKMRILTLMILSVSVDGRFVGGMAEMLMMW